MGQETITVGDKTFSIHLCSVASEGDNIEIGFTLDDNDDFEYISQFASDIKGDTIFINSRYTNFQYRPFKMEASSEELNRVWNVYPSSVVADKDVSNYLKIPYCYLHGKAEEDNQYDLFYIEPGFPDGVNGIFQVNIAGKVGLLFRWINGDPVNNFSPIGRGLCVYSDDHEAVNYAKSKYLSKEFMLL